MELDEAFSDRSDAERAALRHVFDVAARVAPDAELGASYGNPALRYAGRPLIGVGASKAHLNLYVFSPAINSSVQADLEGYRVTKGTVAFTPEKPVPEPIIERMVRARIAEIDG